MTKTETTVQCVKFENVNGVFSILDNELGTELPSNAVLWNPSNGDEIVLTKPIDTSSLEENNSLVTKVYPTEIEDAVTIEFGNVIDYADIELYTSLGKLCYTEHVEQTDKCKIQPVNVCQGVCYLYIKLSNGTIEAHRVVVNKK